MKTEELLRYEMERRGLQACLGPFIVRFEAGAEKEVGHRELRIDSSLPTTMGTRQ